MADRRSLAVVGLAVLAVGIAVRLAPLWWSPLPATLDGFRYAALAERLLATARLPVGVIDADEFVFTLGLAVTSAVTGVPPLRAAQPYVAILGATAPLVGVALAARLARHRGWRGRRVLVTVVFVGLALAVEGLFVRRTGVPDEEALGLVLVPILALVAHRWVASGRRSYGMVTLVLLVAFPPLHNLSALMGVLSGFGVALLHASRARDRRTLVRSGVLGTVAWGVFVGYFRLAASLGLNLTYTGLLRPYLGLFLAWVVVFAGTILWTRQTSTRGIRTLALLPVGVFFLTAAVNTVTPVFPGTVPTPPLVGALVGGLAPLVVVGVFGVDSLRDGPGWVVLATAATPVVFISYLLSASLTPPFFSAVIRVQSFLHVPALVGAGIGLTTVTARLTRGPTRGRRVVAGLVVAVVVAGVVVTAPLGLMHLDTTAVPSTTLESEFEATEFATERVPGRFGTDHKLSRVALHYHTPLAPPVASQRRGRAAIGPARTWLHGGPPPNCPLLSQRSWTTTGAHLYPQPAATVSPNTYRATLAQRHVVYGVGGENPMALSLPRSSNDGC